MQSKQILYEENEIAYALGLQSGLKSSATTVATGVSIDSRTIKSGEVFFALQGENCNGAEFVEQALARGAACAIVDESYPIDHSSTRYNVARLLKVGSPLQALTRLASYARSRSSARIIAITGSVGKTSLRHLLQNILPTPVTASLGNQNNHIGVPMSLARLARDSKYGVFELGMNHAGEIDHLASLVRPHIAVITAISAVHTEALKDEFAVCDAKAEIFNYVSEVALFPSDEKFVELLREKATAAQIAKISTFGFAPSSDYRLREYNMANDKTSARAFFPAIEEARQKVHEEVRQKVRQEVHEEVREIRWSIAGCSKARAVTAVCALALCDLLGLDLATIAGQLPEQQPLVGRGALASLLLEHPSRKIKVIDESYNSSPLALSNALASLSAHPPRRIAALGDMLELGESAEQLHKELAPEAAKYCDLVFTCGELMYALHRRLPRGKRGTHKVNARELLLPLLAALKNGDTLLVKGSMASGMQGLLKNLEQKQKVAA